MKPEEKSTYDLMHSINENAKGHWRYDISKKEGYKWDLCCKDDVKENDTQYNIVFSVATDIELLATLQRIDYFLTTEKEIEKKQQEHQEKIQKEKEKDLLNQKVIWVVGGWNEKGTLEKETFVRLGEAYDTFEDLIEDINTEYGYDEKTNIFHNIVKIERVSENEIYGRYDIQNHCGEIYFKREILK